MAGSGGVIWMDPNLTARLDAHILKAPHHGSHEYTPAFLRAVNPQITTISSGEIPDHGHPRANFLGDVGRHSRSEHPLLYSTALSAVFGKAAREEHQNTVDGLATSSRSDTEAKRELFYKLLPGIINVRTDGTEIHAATRVQTGYWWVTYYPVSPADRSLATPLMKSTYSLPDPCKAGEGLVEAEGGGLADAVGVIDQ